MSKKKNNYELIGLFFFKKSKLTKNNRNYEAIFCPENTF